MYLGGTDFGRRWLVSGSQPVGTRKGKRGIPILVFEKVLQKCFQTWKWFLPFLKEGELYLQMPLSTKI